MCAPQNKQSRKTILPEGAREEEQYMTAGSVYFNSICNYVLLIYLSPSLLGCPGGELAPTELGSAKRRKQKKCKYCFHAHGLRKGCVPNAPRPFVWAVFTVTMCG